MHCDEAPSASLPRGCWYNRCRETSSESHLLLLRRLLARSSLLAIFAASLLLTGARKRGELCLVLDGEVAPAAHLRLVQLREVGVGCLAQGPQASAASSVAI